jgi:orotidine-5'-phosphate decarboxylase
MTSTNAQRDLALALDFESRDEMLEAVGKLGSQRPVLKLGLRLVPHLTAIDIKYLKSIGFRVFIDVKLHDIPTQVGSSVRTWAKFGADFLTIHTSGGRAMIREALKSAEGTGLRILGVSVLTSLDHSDLLDIGVAGRDVSQQVLGLVRMARDAGLNSFVCSAQEISMLKERFPDIYLVTPGLHLEEGRRAADQKRGLHYREAVAQGSDMLVIGRAIWQAPEPEQAVARVMGDLKAL